MVFCFFFFRPVDILTFFSGLDQSLLESHLTARRMASCSDESNRLDDRSTGTAT